jgi:hypothetical protein
VKLFYPVFQSSLKLRLTAKGVFFCHIEMF